MSNNHYVWCTLFVLALPACEPAIIGDIPGAPDSGSTIDSSPPVPDAYQPPIPDAAPPDAPPLPDAPPIPPDAPPIPDAPPPPPPCIEGDDRVLDPETGHCYIVYYTPVNWEAAERWCEDIGAYLVEVTSSAENDLILPLAGTDYNWMGGNDRALEGDWVWSSGAPLSYSNWRAGEPNNSTSTDTVNGEDCMVIEGNRGGSWDDRPCTLRSYNFICERD